MARPNTNLPPVRARILWPALGFPAVISPKPPGESPFVQGDATRSICLLVVSNRKFLSKEEVARSLRFVPWAQRGKRYIATGQSGSFAEVEIAVRNDDPKNPLTLGGPKDARSSLVAFGANADGLNGISATLAKPVRDFYTQQGLGFLNEIRIYERALARLPGDQYHLFWNNESSNENAPSDELALLMRAFAEPRRKREVGAAWERQAKDLMKEYEFEFGSIHRPYSDTAGGRQTRAEILHPLFINRRPSPTLSVGHLTDLHVDVRSDVYEENLIQEKVRVSFANWNRGFDATYAAAKKDSDVLLFTGDLIDYGRGHVGIAARTRLADDAFYHRDRNWFLFYHLVASGNAYTKPVYTILGNHDWRLNPYPPFAFAGAPQPASLIHATAGLTKEQQKEVLRKAHGKPWDQALTYNQRVENSYKLKLKNVPRLVSLAAQIAGGRETLDFEGFPTETNAGAVEWYFLSINPFLDYAFGLPGGHSVLMLDWGEDETVIFGRIYQGKRYTSLDKGTADEGPTARNCLSDLQKTVVERFTSVPGRAKLIGIHAPPLGPWDDWTDDELAVGWRPFDQGGRGYPYYEGQQNGKKVKGHPFFAIRPSKGVVPGAVFGMDASWNSFDQKREWFIKHLADQRRGVRLVLSGHIHRKGLFAAYTAGPAKGPGVAGEMLLKAVPENSVSGVRAPAAANVTVHGPGNAPSPAPGPLYVNGTSVGPRGHVYPAKGVSGWVNPGYAHVELANDGTIQKVAFRWILPENIPSRLRAAVTGVSAPRSGRVPALSH
jgi:hypothetical protein